ncbi:Ig-like domain-containing protein, partial [Domibacillus sp. A3M-37]|uniref:Ig-like domain-containing protein n=1 Tax=Domibacillus sp. A3M-37 TaxID=2962037 RepID=UPI0020B668D3
MFNKKTFFKKFLVQLMVLTLIFTPLAANAAEEVVIVDPTPDTTPPVLTSLSISSNQASPGNPIKITAEISDDLSGVKKAHISYRKPSGTITWASLYLNQTTQKYEGTMSIDTYDEAGEWVLYSLGLTDNKDNGGSVYDDNSNSSGQKFDLDPYKFTVSGVSIRPVTPEPTDKVPPVLNSITISTSQVSGPGTVKLIADASDDDTGVSGVNVQYLKPSGMYEYAYLYFNSTSGKYEGSLNIDQYNESGDWKLNRVYVGDKAKNSTYIYDSVLNPNSSEKQDFSNYKIHVEGITPDFIAPSLGDLALTLVQNTNNTALIKLFAEFNDELSGVSPNFLYAVYAKPSGKTINVIFNRNGTTGKYEASIPIDRYDELGTWKLRYIHVEDNKRNDRIISDKLGSKSLNEWDFSPYYFTVRGVITIPPAVPSSIGLSTKAITMEPGETQQLKATLNMSDTTSKDITPTSSGTVYTSSRPEDVRVDANGQIIVSPNAKPGTVTIQASNSGLSEQCEITIPGAEKESYIIVNPLSVNLSSGQTKQLNVVAKLGGGTTNDVTNNIETTYTSSNTSLVSVTNKGLISIPADAKLGSAKVVVNYNGLIAETTVTFTGPPTIKSIAMTPATAGINYGEKVQMSLRATMSDGTTKDVTNGSTGTTYTTSDSKRATVDANGLVSIDKEARSGTVTIKAINNNQIVQSIITINGVPEVTSIQVTPDTLTMKPGDSKDLQVMFLYSDGTSKDITASSEGTVYTSSAPTRATVDAEGKVTIPLTSTAGTVTITAKNGTFQKAAVLTLVKDPAKEIKSLTVTPGTATLKFGADQQLTVMTTMGDGTQKDVTASSEGTVYTSSAPTRATVDAEGKVT